jgi:hypothetical protein
MEYYKNQIHQLSSRLYSFSYIKQRYQACSCKYYDILHAHVVSHAQFNQTHLSQGETNKSTSHKEVVYIHKKHSA